VLRQRTCLLQIYSSPGLLIAGPRPDSWKEQVAEKRGTIAAPTWQCATRQTWCLLHLVTLSYIQYYFNFLQRRSFPCIDQVSLSSRYGTKGKHSKGQHRSGRVEPEELHWCRDPDKKHTWDKHGQKLVRVQYIDVAWEVLHKGCLKYLIRGHFLIMASLFWRNAFIS